jgi:hypothetical protein
MHWTVLEGFVMGFGITLGGIAAVVLAFCLYILFHYFRRRDA